MDLDAKTFSYFTTGLEKPFNLALSGSYIAVLMRYNNLGGDMLLHIYTIDGVFIDQFIVV